MQEQGFSLIETAFAAVIMGLILAFGLPAFVSYRTVLLEGQARDQLIQDVRRARQLAVTEHCPVVVAFGNGSTTTDVTSYTTHIDTNGDHIKQSSESRVTRALPSGTRFSRVNFTPPDTLVFDINGLLWPSTLGGNIIVYSSKASDTLLVSSSGLVYKQ
jgi:type II secretory pathway pseudopilin PulG